MHGLKSQGSVNNSWKLKMSQFSHGLHIHQTYHQLSMFGMLWIDVYDSLINSMRRCVALHEANGGHTR
jgi:hypothetical protein